MAAGWPIACWLLLAAGCYVVPAPDEAAFLDPDGGRGYDGEQDAALSGDGVQHPSCRFPSSFDPQTQQGARSDSMGSPQIEAWRGIDCADAGPVYPCDTTVYCPLEATCVQPTPGEPGYCAELADCASGVPLTYRAGECAVCTSAAQKAALCCAGAPGVDCRTWPFEPRSRAGELCVDTADCEAGLVCVRRDDTGFALCVCPGVRADGIEHSADCGFSSGPGPWGRQDGVDASACKESAPGWIDELVETAEQFDHGEISAVRAPDGTVHFVYARGGSIRHGFVDAGRATLQDFEPTLPAMASAPAALAIDSSGALHVAYTDLATREGGAVPFGACVTNAGGAWTTPLPLADLFVPTDMALDASDAPVIVGPQLLEGASSGLFAGAVWRQVGEHWSSDSFDTGNVYPDNTRVVVSAVGEPTVYWSQRLVTRFVEGVAVTSELFDVQQRHEAPTALDLVAANGVVTLVFDTESHIVDGREVGLGQVRALQRPGAEAPELLYDHTDARTVREPTQPSIALGPAGERMIAHRVPEGIVLRQDFADTGPNEVITAQSPMSFELAVDGSGEPHLLYVAKGQSAQEPWSAAEELRHVHRGSCL